MEVDPLGQHELETLIKGLFIRTSFDPRHFCIFEDDKTVIKKIAGGHQFHGTGSSGEVVTASSQDGTRRWCGLAYSRVATLKWHVWQAVLFRNHV